MWTSSPFFHLSAFQVPCFPIALSQNVMINDINNNDLGNDIIVQYTTVLATVSSADRSSWDSLTGAESCFSIKSVSRANLGYDLLCLSTGIILRASHKPPRPAAQHDKPAGPESPLPRPLPRPPWPARPPRPLRPPLAMAAEAAEPVGRHKRRKLEINTAPQHRSSGHLTKTAKIVL